MWEGACMLIGEKMTNVDRERSSSLGYIERTKRPICKKRSVSRVTTFKEYDK